MEIIHLYPSLRADADGAALVVRTLIREQLKCNLDVKYSVNNASDIDYENSEIKWSDIFIAISWRLRGVWLNAVSRELYEVPRIIHVHGLWSLKTIIMVFALSNKSSFLVCSAHGMLSDYSFKVGKLKKMLFYWIFQKKFLESCVFLISSSDMERSYLSHKFPDLRVKKIPNGVDIPDCTPHDLEIENGFLYFGRIDPVKNICMLIDAWKIATQEVPNIVLNIVGSGSQKYIEYCRQYADSLEIENINFYPEIPFRNRYAVYNSSVTTILPSKTENFGLVVAESLISRVPVIVSVNTPWHEVVDRGCGWCVSGDAEALSDAIIEAASMTQDELRAMGTSGEKWMKSCFSWSSVNAATVELYESCLNS